MRDIKFRIFDKISKKMYFDSELENGTSAVINISGGLLFSDDDSYKETDFELMQFTGLKDKNGKEIYEGDIVKFLDFKRDDDFLNTGAIKICNGLGVIIIDRYSVDMEDINFESDVEVIGNIYEKPNWLEEKYK